MDMLMADMDALDVEYCLCLNSGVQAYLNKCFAADGAVSEYLNQLKLIPCDSDVAASESILELRSKCMRLNLDILSGDAAEELLKTYSAYFDFEGDIWLEWRLGVDKRFKASLDVIVIMQDAAYRLIHKLDKPSMHLLEVCRLPEGSIEHDIQDIVLPIREKHNACNACVDKFFTHIWLARFLDMGSTTCMAAHKGLCDIVSILRVSTVLVEKKHLVGQELRPAKRGRGVAATSLVLWYCKNRLSAHQKPTVRQHLLPALLMTSL